MSVPCRTVHYCVVPSDPAHMATVGGVGKGEGEHPNPNVTDLLRRLNLTEEEEAVADFSDDEETEESLPVEWTIVGKVLSPTPVHVNTVRSAMKPAWGNPIGLKFRSIGMKGDNMFVAEFGCKTDMERTLAGTPWMVGRYAVILQHYDEKLSASEIVFDRMEMWVRILNLPLGWMNQARGARAMSLIGRVVKMDVDADGKASGAFLRARVAVEIDKPLRRGVLLRMSKTEDPRWFQAQYEKLPYYCFACGVIGHSEVDCLHPVARDEQGKLPYDVQLRAPEERRKRWQSFVGAAAESYGSGTSSASKPPRTQHSKSGNVRTSHGEDGSSHQPGDADETDDQVVQSPLKQQVETSGKEKAKAGTGASKQLDMQDVENGRPLPRKRKSKVNNPSTQTPDLNIPLQTTNAIVPVGLVTSRVNQLDGNADNIGESMSETLKKQKRGNPQSARSAAAAQDSPRRAQ